MYEPKTVRKTSHLIIHSLIKIKFIIAFLFSVSTNCNLRLKLEMLRWGQIRNLIHGLKPALMMVVVQVAFAGVNIFYKLAANDGMSLRVIIAYRLIFATILMFPLALILERFILNIFIARN